MSNLRVYWEEYKRIELKGERTKRCFELEQLIHDEQKIMDVSRYDFNSRWARKIKAGTPTITGPSLAPAEDPEPAPTSNFTFEYAKDKIGENDFAILEECAMRAELYMVCLATILETVNPDNKSNMARRGQATNIAIKLFEEMKEKAQNG